MKYLKQYESQNKKYKIGDYVLLDDVPEYGWTIYMYAKILNITIENENRKSIVYYDLSAISKKTGDLIIIKEIENYVILRKLTSEEIEKFEILLDQNKYNL